MHIVYFKNESKENGTFLIKISFSQAKLQTLGISTGSTPTSYRAIFKRPIGKKATVCNINSSATQLALGRPRCWWRRRVPSWKGRIVVDKDGGEEMDLSPGWLYSGLSTKIKCIWSFMRSQHRCNAADWPKHGLFKYALSVPSMYEMTHRVKE